MGGCKHLLFTLSDVAEFSSYIRNIGLGPTPSLPPMLCIVLRLYLLYARPGSGVRQLRGASAIMSL